MPSINDVVALYTSWEGRFAYRQAEGRLNPVQSGFGDCSSTIWRAYKDVLGIDVGTWTGEQVGRGQHVMSGSYTRGWDISKLQPGDLVLMGQGGISHVELYVGNNQFSGHGGPGYGPTRKNATQYISWWATWTVRRHVVVTPAPTPTKKPIEEIITEEDPMKGLYYHAENGAWMYMLFNEASGFYSEFSNGPTGKMPGAYVNGIAKNWDTKSWPQVTPGHARALKRSLDLVRKGA